MVAANFPQSLKFDLVEEGGNDDDPHDHGGRTSRGIIQTEWDAWRARHADLNLPADVWRAPQDQIEAIYHEQYWEPYCDRLPSGIDLEFFDFSVNSGRSRAVKTLQKALGVEPDGMMGLITWGAVEHADVHALVDDYAARRRAFYQALAQFPRYGKGWLARTARCEALAGKLSDHPAPAEAPAHVPGPSPKAQETDVKKPPLKPEGGVVVAGGSGGLIAILEQLKEAIGGYAGTVKYVEYILFAVAVATFALTLYGFWHRNQMQEQVG